MKVYLLMMATRDDFDFTIYKDREKAEKQAEKLQEENSVGAWQEEIDFWVKEYGVIE